MDTIGASIVVGAGSAERLASRLINSTRRAPDGSERTRAYGALRLSTVTLFPTDRVIGARFCIEFSAPKVLFGENATSLSALGARTAAAFVLDEVEAALGLALHDEPFTIYRLDVARTLPLDAPSHLPSLARIDLSRRTRTVYEDGVMWSCRGVQEVLYDKHAELLAEAKRRSRDVSVSDFPDDSGLPDRAVARARALDDTAGRCLRVEVRLRGSQRIRSALKVPDTSFASVVTDENAALLFQRFLAHFAFASEESSDQTAAALRASGVVGRRLLQLLGLRALLDRGLTDEQCRCAAGLRGANYRYLKSTLDAALAGAAQDGKKNALVVTREELAETAERDRRMQSEWLERRRTYRRSLSLSPDAPALLAALP